jgi:phosphopantothenoylcysteine decarboxylase/phosphopantothenate--cysteine ligase
MTGYARVDGKRVLLAGTGAPAVTALPEAVLRLRYHCPNARARVLLTRQALRFVTRTTVNLVTGEESGLDEWSDEPYTAAPHVELGRWAEAVIVYPATLHFTGRLALGLSDTPLLLALQCTTAPIVLVPSLPPGGAGGHAYQKHVEALHDRPNVAVVPPVAGYSMTTGELNVGAPAPFAEALGRLDELLRDLAATPAGEPRPVQEVR